MAKQNQQVYVQVTRTVQAAGKPTESAYFGEGGLVIPRSDVIATQGKTLFYKTHEYVGTINDIDSKDGVTIYKTENGAVIALQPGFIFVGTGASGSTAEEDDGDEIAIEPDAEEEAPKRGRRAAAEAPAEAPKRRGRPPKKVDEEPVDIEDDDDEPVAPKRTRRAEPEDDDEPVAPKSRRKAPVEDEADEPDADEAEAPFDVEDDEPAPKRGAARGRSDDDEVDDLF
jgi:hypothetical protein